jgi:hypothetical protein
MGCHTWYKKLITNDQEEIIKKVKDVIETSKYYWYWYEFTTLDDLFESTEPVIEDIADYVFDSLDGLDEVNGVYGIYKSADGYDIDSPRIGGYPEIIITSTEEMFEAMEKGLTGWRGDHYMFSYDKEEEDYIKDNIINFFKEYPDGIITFG